jgi:hypothetical protein
MNFTFFDDKVDHEILCRITDEFFNNEVLAVDPELESACTINGKLTFGTLAGCLYHVQHLLHEMSHFLDIDDARVLDPGWGLRYGEWVHCSFSRQGGWYAVKTAQHIQREIKVHAFQWVLSQYFGMPEIIEEMTSAVPYLPDTALVKLLPEWTFGHVPYAEFDRTFHKFFTEQVFKTSQSITIDSIKLEWSRKVKYLQDQGKF